MGIQNFKRYKFFFDSPNFINYNNNFKIKIEFIASQLTLRSDLISLRHVSACSPTPQRARTAKQWSYGGLAALAKRARAHAMHARALHPCLAVMLAWPLLASRGPPGCQACDVVHLPGHGGPTTIRPHS